MVSISIHFNVSGIFHMQMCIKSEKMCQLKFSLAIATDATIFGLWNVFDCWAHSHCLDRKKFGPKVIGEKLTVPDWSSFEMSNGQIFHDIEQIVQ